MTKTAPLPVFGTFTQPGLDRIAMNVAQLFDELRMIPNIEIVISLLPEMLGIANQAPRHPLFQGLERISQRLPLGFAQQQMYMLGHDYVAIHAKSELAPQTFQCRFENSHRRMGGKQWTTMITTEGK